MQKVPETPIQPMAGYGSKCHLRYLGKHKQEIHAGPGIKRLYLKKPNQNKTKKQAGRVLKGGREGERGGRVGGREGWREGRKEGNNEQRQR
jgi:hypothetical protein